MSKRMIEKVNKLWEKEVEDNRLKIVTESGDENIVDLLKNIKFESSNLSLLFEGERFEFYTIDYFSVGCRYKDINFKITTVDEDMYSGEEWYIDGEFYWEDYLEAKYYVVESIDKVGELGWTKEQVVAFKNMLQLIDMRDICYQYYEEGIAEYIGEQRKYWQNIIGEQKNCDVNISNAGLLLKIEDKTHEIIIDNIEITS